MQLRTMGELNEATVRPPPCDQGPKFPTMVLFRIVGVEPSSQIMPPPVLRRIRLFVIVGKERAQDIPPLGVQRLTVLPVTVLAEYDSIRIPYQSCAVMVLPAMKAQSPLEDVIPPLIVFSTIVAVEPDDVNLPVIALPIIVVGPRDDTLPVIVLPLMMEAESLHDAARSMFCVTVGLEPVQDRHPKALFVMSGDDPAEHRMLPLTLKPENWPFGELA